MEKSKAAGSTLAKSGGAGDPMKNKRAMSFEGDHFFDCYSEFQSFHIHALHLHC